MNLFKISFFWTLLSISGVAASQSCPGNLTTYQDTSTGKIGYAYSGGCHCHLRVVDVKPFRVRDPNMGRNIGDPIFDDGGRYTNFYSPYDGMLGRGTEKRFPKSQKILDDYFKEKKSCPDEPVFQSFMATYRQEVAVNQKQDEVKQREQKIENDKRVASRKASLQTHCKGNPKVSVTLIERFSSRLQVSPDTIKLSRVSLDLGWDGSCKGVFYTPKGAKNCELEFNQSGVVTGLKSCD